MPSGERRCPPPCGKVRFYTRDWAERRARKINGQEGRRRMRVYRGRCGYWHLSRIKTWLEHLEKAGLTPERRSRMVIRSQAEIDDLANRVSEAIDDGESRYFGKTYEEGVYETLHWLLSADADDPYPEEE